MGPRARIAVLLLCVIALFSAGLYYFHYIPDDTYIGLRYAQNLLEGNGLVFNEGARIEGYTNFLWIMIVATAGLIGLPLVPAARVIGFFFSLATLILAASAAHSALCAEETVGSGGEADRRSGWNEALVVALPPLALAASAPFLAWSLSGTEIPLFTFLLLAGFVLLRDRRGAGAVLAVFGLLGLVRPEGLLFYLIAGAILLVRGGRRGVVLRSWFGILALLYGPYLLWKIRYFGSIVPNTFYAKTGPIDIMVANGARYVSGFLLRYGYLLVIGVLLGRRATGSVRGVLVPVAFIAAHWMALVLLGGDWMPHYRLLVPTMPIMLLVVSRGLAATARAPATPDRRHNPLPVVALLLVFFAVLPGASGYEAFRLERITVGAYARLGRRLGDILPPGTSIACGSTGAIGYYGRMRIIDILGLTEERIARRGAIVATQPGHMKSDGSYVLDQEPDLILLGNVRIHRGARDRSEIKVKLQERDIAVNPRFLRDYEYVNIPLGGEFHLSCYKRRDYFLPID